MTRALLLTLASVASLAAAAAPIPEEAGGRAAMERQYGKWFNPGRDAEYQLNGDRLRVKLTARRQLHRLPGDDAETAPYTQKEVVGDFEAVVRVTCPHPGREGGTGMWPAVTGGLTAGDGGPEFIHLWRGVGRVNGKPEGVVRHYCDGEGHHLSPRTFATAADSLYIRLKRQGKSVLAGMSRDGKVWTDMDAKPVGWEPRVRIGVVAENTLGVPAEVTFDRYSLTQPKNGPGGSP